jgi:hypothetical protein
MQSLIKSILSLVPLLVLCFVGYWLYTKFGNKSGSTVGGSLGNDLGTNAADFSAGLVGGVVHGLANAATKAGDALLGDPGPSAGSVPSFLSGGTNATNDAGTAINPGGYFTGDMPVQPLTLPNLTA